VVAVFIKQLLQGEKPTINGTGKQTRDLIYVDDVAYANLLALNKKSKNLEVYNIGTGKEISINDLYKKMAGTLSIGTKPIHGPQIRGEVNRSCLKNIKAKKILGWKTNHTLDQGIDKTVKYFKKEVA